MKSGAIQLIQKRKTTHADVKVVSSTHGLVLNLTGNLKIIHYIFEREHNCRSTSKCKLHTQPIESFPGKQATGKRRQGLHTTCSSLHCDLHAKDLQSCNFILFGNYVYINQAQWILRHFKFDPGSNQPSFRDMMLARTGCSRCHSSWGENMLFIQRASLWKATLWDRVFYIVEGLGRLQFKGAKNVSDILLSLNTTCSKLSFHCL